MTTSTLEPLISSRIRRALLEHLLAHPAERFYLRGLAKELNLSISPTRRELKRLEAHGLLKTYQEANILFYHVDRTAPLFLQLTAALRSASAAPEIRCQTPSTDFGDFRAEGLALPRYQTPSVSDTVARRYLTPSWRVAMEGAALSLIVAGVLAGVAYLAYTNQRLLMVTKRAVLEPKTQVTVVEPASASTASGAMRGTRWQLVPGGMGGVSSESY